MRTLTRSRTARWLAAAAAATLLTACGGDDEPSTPVPTDDEVADDAEASDDASGAQLADGTEDGADDASMAADGGDMLAEDDGEDDGADDGADAVDGEGAATAQVPPLLDEIDGWPETTVTFEGEAPTEILAKVADEVDRRQQGLMHVEDLPEGVGMLFLFEELQGGGFWMKNTLVPLDIAYIAGDEVVAVLQMDPCEADPCPSYEPGIDYDAALEVNQGALAEAGVSEGTTVTWTDPVEVSR